MESEVNDMKDKLKTLAPFTFLDYQELELYLNDKVKEGYILQRLGFIMATFKRCDCADRKYRVFPQASDTMSAEEHDLYKATGWHISYVGRNLAILYTDDHDAPELFDPDSFRQYSKKYLRSVVLQIVCFTILIGSLLKNVVISPLMNPTILDGEPLSVVVILIGLTLAVSTILLCKCYLLVKQYLRIRNGIVASKVDYIASIRFNLLTYITVVVTLIAVIAIW